MGVWHGVPEGKCSNADTHTHTPITLTQLQLNPGPTHTHRKHGCHVPPVRLMLQRDVSYASPEKVTRAERKPPSDNITKLLFSHCFFSFSPFIYEKK